MNFFDRTELIMGEEKLKKLQKAHVMVAGLGGVGAIAAEMLVRASVGKLTIIDFDTVNLSNINRQIIALHSNLGEKKVEAMAKRLKDINPEVELNVIDMLIDRDNAEQLIKDYRPDYLLDAIDSLSCKMHLLAQAYHQEIPTISSMGAARKFDPSKVVITDLTKTKICPLARQVRKRINQYNIGKGIMAIYSTEFPTEKGPHEEIDGHRGRSINGTISYMTSLFGLYASSHILQKLMES